MHHSSKPEAPLASAPAVMAPDLSVVVPVKNEAENILPLVTEIDAALDGFIDFEIVYVDDGSDDDTPGRLAEARTRFPRLRAVRHGASCGQSQAVATGVKHARGTWIATLDGDGQNDPADIPAMIRCRDQQAAASGSDGALVMIAGHRRKRHDTWFRRLSSKVANGVRSALLKDATPDSGCGLKLFARQTFLDLPRFDHMHRFLPALMIRAGGTVVSVGVNHRPRERGTSKYGLWNRLWVGIVDLFGVAWLRRRSSLPRIERVD